NAANEMAGAAFVGGKIGFGGIDEVEAEVLARLGPGGGGASVGAVLELDAEARALAAQMVTERCQ
ncbi:MAG: 1-deoxy-D-xylulose-5-phosphate reductoisomerase, partial [Burkholderiaceae bacterium]|nr:1-deoxy-D-xylulose-5-phosphate reductoisomerase [Burkholderiaceae bacterium]